MPRSRSGRITSTSNPHVKYARKLHRRRVREKEGRCLLEGVRLVKDVHEAGASLVLGFWEESLLGQPGGEDLLRRLETRPPAGGLFEVSPQVLAELADTETPQGVVVVADRPSPDPAAVLGGGGPEGPPSTVVVLDNLRDPGNVGTVIRSADASGAAVVLYLPGTADPFGPKALRAAMGSTFHLPVVPGEAVVAAHHGAVGGRPGEGPVSRSELAAELPALLHRLGYRVFAADPSGDVPHWQADLGGRTAVVLGGEAEGPDPVLWSAAERVAVPMLGRAESLNVAMAAAVLLYEAARRREGWT